MSDSNSTRGIIEADPVTRACDLLELLGQRFCAQNVDYECIEGVNRFLVLHERVWHAVSFSDTALLLRAPADLQEEIARVVERAHAGAAS